MSLQLWQQNDSKLYFDYVCPFFIISVQAFWILIFGSEFDFSPVWKSWFILEQICFLFTWFTQWNLGKLDFTRSLLTGSMCTSLHNGHDIYFLSTFFMVFFSLPRFPRWSPENNISRFYIVPYSRLKLNSTGCGWHKQKCGTAFWLLWTSLILENSSFCVLLILVLSLVVLLTHKTMETRVQRMQIFYPLYEF